MTYETELERELARRLHTLAEAYTMQVDKYAEVSGEMAAILAEVGLDNRRFVSAAHGATQHARALVSMVLDGVPDPGSEQ